MKKVHSTRFTITGIRYKLNVDDTVQNVYNYITMLQLQLQLQCLKRGEIGQPLGVLKFKELNIRKILG